MQRYTITVVDPGSPDTRPILAVPFEPSALVSAFIDELFRRIAKQGLKLTPELHIATLHLDSETGAIIDTEDILSDVVTDPKTDQIFAVFASKQIQPVKAEDIRQQLESSSLDDVEDRLLVRFIPPPLAKKDKASIPPVSIVSSATVKQLHELAARHVGLPAIFDAEDVDNECNCNLAKKISEGSNSTKHVFLVHGKSIVKRIDIDDVSDTAIDAAIKSEFGHTVFTEKKILRYSGESQQGKYTRLPVVAICSKARHVPMHARGLEEHSDEHQTHRLVDLHTSEQPISAASMSVTLSDAALGDLAVDGIVDIYVVNRATNGSAYNSIGKNNIYRARPHWEPVVAQNERGVAMFLSSLRVFISLVPGRNTDARMRDAVLHVVDLMLRFPPCTRALLLLIDGKTLSPSESAAIAQAVYETLHDILMPTGIIGTSTDRVFEGARLLFGFILEKARTLKLSSSTVSKDDDLPYLASFETIDVKDFMTAEPILDPVRTTSGLLERSLATTFDQGGVLAESHLQPRLAPEEPLPSSRRFAILAGGSRHDVVTLNTRHLALTYRYPDAGNIEAAIDTSELSQLGHLAEVAARNQLSVHRPAQLASAVAPCLTFDRSAHLAVYTGQQACGTPGESNLIFRPMHGEGTVNATIIEQLIAPVLKRYEADGSIVFDSYGGAVLRRLQAPDEMLFFCVDTSASMRELSDFLEVNEQTPVFAEETTAGSIVQVEHYGKASLDEMKDTVGKYQAFRDMLAMVVAGDGLQEQRRLAFEVIALLRMLMGNEIVAKHEHLQQHRDNARSYYARQAISEADSSLKKLKLQWAGLQTHQEALQDFLVYRATTSPDVNVDWQWHMGEDVPTTLPPTQIATLSEALAHVPDDFRCPISHGLMEDPVTASDGFTYSRSAIEQWFEIRISSPMTGLPLQDTDITPNDEVASAVAEWIKATDLQEMSRPPAKKTRSSAPKHITVTFLGKDGKFERNITSETTVADLYKMAFRGMKARFMAFQLALEDASTLRPGSTSRAVSKGVSDNEQITVRIADEVDAPRTSAEAAQGHALIKVYELRDMSFSFWVPRNTPHTMETIMWKYWRHSLETRGFLGTQDVEVWTNLSDTGDGLMTGIPRSHTDNLSLYLNTAHCTGRLEAEELGIDGRPGLFAGAFNLNQPLVLKVELSKRRTVSDEARQESKLTRLDVLKQMFEAYINRAIAYGYKTHMGLVTFNTIASVKTSLTHVVENFRRSTDDMVGNGDTALWDAVALCRDQLNEYAKRYPGAKKRIIVISDGEDTKSKDANPGGLAFDLRNDNIIVDSVALGNENSQDLRFLSQLVGGYRFKPTSLVNALSMVEMEPFLSLAERPDSAITLPASTPTSRPMFHMYFQGYKFMAQTTPFGSDNYPARKEHENLHDDFIELAAASDRPVMASQSVARGHFRTTRLMNEMRSIIASSGQRTYDIYVSEGDMSFWKVVMKGPEGSAYEGGTFLLYLHASENYPTFAPEARFVTRMMHPNINAHGRICHALLSRDWTSDISMSTLLDTIFGLLMQAELSDPIHTTTALDYHHDQVDFAEEVRSHVVKNAWKTREQWKAELVGQ